MAIGDDTDIDYTNRIIDLTGTTIYDVSVLYSYCKEQFKLSPNIDDDFAWNAPADVSFDLKAGWLLRRRSIQRLKGATITANYAADVIEKINLQAGGYTNYVEADIGTTVTDDAATVGELLDYDNSRRTIWVRWAGARVVVATGSDIDAGTTLNNTSTGSSVNVLQDRWTNIVTIGDLAATGPQPFMYAYVGDLDTGDGTGNARRYEGREDDPDPAKTNADRGSMDVLLNIIDAGVTLGNPAGFIRVYGRQGLDKFADFPIDISPGARISVPIAQSNDVEDLIGEVAMAVNGQSATDFTAGEIINDDAGAWSAEVVEYIEGVDSSTSVLILRGLTAYPADDDAFTGVTSGATGVVRGEVGGQLWTYDVETTPIDEADYANVLTSGGASGWTGVLRGHLTIAEGGGTNGYAIVETRHDVKATATDYVALGDNESVTGTGVSVTSNIATGRYNRLCYDLDDIRIKQAFQRLDGITAGDAARGDNITQAVSGAQGTILEIIDTTEIHVGTNNGVPFDTTNTISDDDGGTLSGTPSSATRDETFQYALSLQALQNYWIMVDGAGRTNTEIFHYVKYFQQARSTGTRSDPNALNSDADQHMEIHQVKQELGGGTLILQLSQGEEYFRGFTDEDTPANNPVDQSGDSRILVKPGTSITTGQGVALINVASADANLQTLTDTAGAKHQPFTSVSLALLNTISGDHISVALDNGSGQEDKAQVTSGVGNLVGDVDIVLDATLPNDTPVGSPNDGVIKMTDVSSTSPENAELRYRYASYAAATVTLVAGDTGTATSAGTGTVLNDTGIELGTLEVGDVIRNTVDGSFAWIKEILTNQVITTQLEGGGDNTWDNTDTWESNTLAVAYVNGVDTGFIPYMDREADATSETETLTFVTPRNVVIVVRNTAILDFVTTGTIGANGLTVGTVRTTDPQFTPT